MINAKFPMINQKKDQKGGILKMNATRATLTTTDGAVFGSTTETPPEDPPPRVRRKINPEALARLIAHILIALLHILATVAHVATH